MTVPGRLHIRTVRVDDDRPLLDLVTIDGSTPTVYVRDGDGFVATGVAVRPEVPSHAGRLAALDEVLRRLATAADVTDDVGLPGTTGLAFGSFTFDPGRSGSVLMVPREVIGRRHGVTWRTSIASSDEQTPSISTATSAPPVLIDWRTTAAVTDDGATTEAPDGSRAATSRSRPRFAGSSLKDEDWLTAVAHAVRGIEDGALEKVVLARDRRLWARTPFDVRTVLRALATRFPSCTTFHVEGLVGASPELLLAREGGTARSEVLAGTAARSRDQSEDEAFGAALMASAKDRREHELAATSARVALEALRLQVTLDGPTLLRLDNVQHLASRLMAHAPDDAPRGSTSLPRSLALVEALHPTAAVGGWPRAAALELIARLEGLDRGRYAGPVGWTSFDGDGDWSIALRCAEIDGDRARLFAGAGIVRDSRPADELRETQLKLRAMLQVLEEDAQR